MFLLLANCHPPPPPHQSLLFQMMMIVRNNGFNKTVNSGENNDTSLIGTKPQKKVIWSDIVRGKCVMNTK